jgi:hypothetical protein
MQIPAEASLPENHFHPSYPGQYGSLNPYQQQLQNQNMALTNNGLDLQNSLLQTTLLNLWRGGQGQGQGQSQDQDQDQDESQEDGQPQPQPQPTFSPSMPRPEQGPMTVNLHVHIDSATASQFSNHQSISPLQNRAPGLRRTLAREFSREPFENPPQTAPRGLNLRQGCSLVEVIEEHESERWPPRTTPGPGPKASADNYPDSEASQPRHRDGNGNGPYDYTRARRGIMSMANSPLSASLLTVLSERGER